MHTLSYDVLGRMTSDAVTTLGAGVDGSVRRIEIAYDTQDNPYLFTSFDAASGGNIVNQVQRGFNGLAQLTTEYQSHSGAVNTGTTPKVQYGYTDLSAGNNSRLTSMTYPNGKVLNYNYATGLDSNISRLTALSDTSGTLESYSYLGLDTVVQRARSEISTNLIYIKQTGDSNGDAGDQYIGLDRFGRVVDQRWLNTGNLAATDRFQYGYDRDSNALYRNNLVNTAFGELYHASGAGNGYDNLNQLSGFLRGVLSASGGSGTPLDTISSPSTTESWSPDALGNFSSITTNTTTQTRTHNQQNEITSITGATTPTYDANGNLTTDEQGQTYKYDAWNRLVQVKNSGGTVIASYSYDGLGRRIQETHSGTVNDLYYSAAWQVLEERTGGVSTATVQYVWSPVYVDALVQRDRSTQNNGTLDETLWVQQDANWNVTALVNGSGTVVERYIYDPYGQVTYLNASFGTISGSAYSWIFGFEGLRLDTVTGNNYARGREYRSALSRWLEIDPLRFGAGDSNLYRAFADGPTNLLDPSGELGIFFDGCTFKRHDRTVISTLASRYKDNTGEEAYYFHTDLGTLDKTVSDAFAIVKRDWEKSDHKESIDIFGWSRGGPAAYALANRIKNDKDMANATIRFIGVFDPTLPLKSVESKEVRDLMQEELGASVQFIGVVARGNAVKKREFNEDEEPRVFNIHYQLMTPKVGKESKTKLPEVFWENCTHGESGFKLKGLQRMWQLASDAKVPGFTYENFPYDHTNYNDEHKGGAMGGLSRVKLKEFLIKFEHDKEVRKEIVNILEDWQEDH